MNNSKFSEWLVAVVELVRQSITWSKSLFESIDLDLKKHMDLLVKQEGEIADAVSKLKMQDDQLTKMNSVIVDLQKQITTLNSTLGIVTVVQPVVLLLGDSIVPTTALTDSTVFVQELITAKVLDNKAGTFFVKNNTKNTYDITDVSGANFMLKPNDVVSITLIINGVNITQVTDIHLIIDIVNSETLFTVPVFTDLVPSK